MPDFPNFDGAAPISDRRARTRAALIEAASQVIGEKGFRGATLDDVAARAGMTKGAIYGNFASKEDLFLAVVQASRARARAVFEPGLSFKQQMRKLGQSVAAMAPAAQAQAAMTVELELYALTHEAMRARLNEVHGEGRARSVRHVRETMDEATLPMSPEDLVIVLGALQGGLLHQRFMTPELVPDALIVRAFEALAGASAPDPKPRAKQRKS